MSAPGFFYADPNQPAGQITPQQRMAMALMENRNFNPQQAYSGVADAGSNLAGAYALKALNDKATGLGPVDVTPQQVGGGIGAWLQRNLGI